MNLVSTVLLLTTTVATKTNVRGVKLSDLLITRRYNSTAQNALKYKSEEESDDNDEENIDDNVQNATNIIGQNITKLTFGEMVTIYHDIWNTMLIGKTSFNKSYSRVVKSHSRVIQESFKSHFQNS